MARHNPYSLTFGKEPLQIIQRIAQEIEIIDTFSMENPTNQLYIITGVRGVGKTVMMTEISQKISQDESWITIELNPEGNMIKSLGAKLYSVDKMQNLFDGLSISASLFGFGVEVQKNPRIVDEEVAISEMLKTLKKRNKRLLITVDEATNNAQMRRFASAFQILIRQDLPVFLIMTGLYENINALMNVDNLTFLYRAPKCVLKPLNNTAMISNYQSVLNISREKAAEMAELTKGYSYAFQVLGYLTYENNGEYEPIIDLYRQYLEEYVYEKIWSELSAKDQELVVAIAESKTGKVSDIREIIDISNNEFNPYRGRLIKKGIVNGDKRGYVTFNLPFFGEFAIDMMR